MDYSLIILLLIAVINAYTAWTNYQTRIAVVKTEMNTNSMKDALVAATARMSHAEGVEEGRVKEVNREKGV